MNCHRLAGVPYEITFWRKPGPLLPGPADCSELLNLLRRQAAAGNIRLLAYCLLREKAQVVLESTSPGSLRRCIRCIQDRFRFPGSLRSRSRSFDRAHVQTVLHYAEREPLRQGIVRRAEDFEWSSAVAHVWGIDGKGVLWMPWWWEKARYLDWRSELERELETRDIPG